VRIAGREIFNWPMIARADLAYDTDSKPSVTGFSYQQANRGAQAFYTSTKCKPDIHGKPRFRG